MTKLVTKKLATEIMTKICGKPDEIIENGGIFRRGYTLRCGLVEVNIDLFCYPNDSFASEENKYPHGYIRIDKEIVKDFYYKENLIVFGDCE